MAVQVGAPYREVLELLAIGGGSDISDKISTEPIRRIIVTERNRDILLQGLGFSKEKRDKITVADLQMMLDRANPAAPAVAELTFWDLPRGPSLEILATGSDMDNLTISSMRVYPDGFPHDKRNWEIASVVIEELSFSENGYDWRSSKESNNTGQQQPPPAPAQK